MNGLFKEFTIFSPVVILIRIILAVFAGFFIGLDRERHSQPAGLRTHMVIALGSCLLMILSIYIPVEFMKQGFTSDPTRLAAQVITGIGFLGAGAIFRFGFNVKGLTTAASIWTTSGIGLCVGAGYYFLGITSTILLIVILYVFDKIEDHIIEKRNWRVITIDFEFHKLLEIKIIETIKAFGIVMKQPSIMDNVEKKSMEITINCKIDEDFNIRDLFEKIKSLGHIKTLRID